MIHLAMLSLCLAAPVPKEQVPQLTAELVVPASGRLEAWDPFHLKVTLSNPTSQAITIARPLSPHHTIFQFEIKLPGETEYSHLECEGSQICDHVFDPIRLQRHISSATSSLFIPFFRNSSRRDRGERYALHGEGEYSVKVTLMAKPANFVAVVNFTVQPRSSDSCQNMKKHFECYEKIIGYGGDGCPIPDTVDPRPLGQCNMMSVFTRSKLLWSLSTTKQPDERSRICAEIQRLRDSEQSQSLREFMDIQLVTKLLYTEQIYPGDLELAETVLKRIPRTFECRSDSESQLHRWRQKHSK